MANGIEVVGLELDVAGLVKGTEVGAAALDKLGNALAKTGDEADKEVAKFNKVGTAAEETAVKLQSFSASRLAASQQALVLERDEAAVRILRQKQADDTFEKSLADMAKARDVVAAKDLENTNQRLALSQKALAAERESAAAQIALQREVDAVFDASIAQRQSAEIAFSAFKIRTLAENRAAAIADINAMEEARLASIEKEKSAQTAFAAFKIRTLSENKARELALQTEQAEAAVKLAEKQAIEEIRWGQMSLKAKIAQLEELKRYQANSAISSSTINDKFSGTTQNALPQLTAMQKEYAAALENTHASHGKVSSSGSILSNIFDNNRARTEALVIAHETLQGRLTKIPGSIMVLAEYANLAMGAVLQAGLLLVAVGGLAYEIYQGAKEQKGLNDALIRTNSISGETISSLTSLANATGDLHGNLTQSNEAVRDLAASGKFTSEQLGFVTKAVVDLNYAFGAQIKDSIKEFESLVVKSTKAGVEGTFEVSKALEKLDEKYHFVNASLMEEIINLEKEGKQREASALALKSFADESEKASARSVENFGAIEKIWNSISTAVSRAKHDIMSIGAKETPQEEIDALSKKIANAQDPNRIRDSHEKNVDAAIIKNETQNLINLVIKKNEEDAKAIATGKEKQAQSEADHVLVTRAIEDTKLMKKTRSELDNALAKNAEELKIIEAARPGYAADHKKELKDRLIAIQEAHTKKVAAIKDGSKQILSAIEDAAEAEYKLATDKDQDKIAAIKKQLDEGVVTRLQGFTQIRALREDEAAAIEVANVKEIAQLQAFNAKGNVVEQERIKLMIQKAQERTALRRQQLAEKEDADKEEQDRFGAKQINKITDQNNLDSAKLFEAGDALKKYGLSGRQTNIELAELQLTKSKLDESLNAGVAADLRASAAIKDLGQAYHNLQQIQLNLAKETPTVTARDVIGDEQAKVAIWAESAQKHIAFEWQVAEATYAAATASAEGTTAIQDAAFAKAKQAAQDASATVQRLFNQKFEIAGLKDVGTQFEKIGSAASKMGESWKGVATAMAGFGKGLKDIAAIEEREARDKKTYTAERIGAYGDMADAAAQFFDKQSSGYKALEGVSKAFHAAQMAMQLVEMAQSAIAAVMKAASQGGWVSMVAMAAAMAALGFAAAGAGGGGGPADAATRQASAGTGSVLDDPTAKSESIKNAIEYVGKVSSNVLSHTISMDNSLKTLVENIRGFTSIIIQGGANGQIKNVNNQATNPLEKGVLGSLRGMDVVGTVLDKLFGSKLSNSLFGGKTSTTDTGLNFASGTVGSIGTNGATGNQYQDVKTSGGLFHSDKFSTLTQGLSPEITGQFSKVIGGIADSVKLASGLVGLSGDTFTAKLNSFVVNIGAISTKGLTGDQIQKQFETIFSKFGDDLAKFATAGSLNLVALAKAGEGSFQTLIRVATDLTTVNGVFTALGLTLLSVNSTGVKAAESLVSAFGGLDKFTSAGDSYFKNFYSEGERTGKTMDALKVAFKDLGVAMPVDRAQFRASVEAAAAKQDWVLVASLMKLGDTFASVVPAVENVNEAVKIVALTAKQTSELNIQIMELEGNKSGALAARRDQELLTMDAAGQAIMRRIYLLRDEAAIAQQGYGLDTQILQLKGDTAKLRERELALLEPANRAKQIEIWALQGKAAADAKAAQADQAAAAAAQQAAQQADQAAKQITAAWQSITDSLFKEVQRIRGIISGDGNKGFATAQSEFAIATAQARGGNQDAAKLLPQLSQTLLQLAQQNASSLQELNLIRARTAQSLTDTATGLSGSHGTVKIPGFASGGEFEGGVRLVGENGPEVERTGASRITNASETSGIFGKQDALIKTLTSQVSKLNSTVEKLVAPTVSNEKNTRKIKDNIQRVTRDGEVMYTTPTPTP